MRGGELKGGIKPNAADNGGYAMHTHITHITLKAATMWDHGVVLRADNMLETRCGEMLRAAWAKRREGKVCVAVHTLAGEEPCTRSREIIRNLQHS